ncbi:MAG: TetR/AcrR family transcriptional regulator [Nitrosopumilus sp.]|uniref:TetR/AcrR family transcriptional regulator n=1 Tax=Nitrosopumilus sp. TaxID=2024843 RepID=UPI00242E6E1B|nr:TetR/AcrR family transcriptional regulator [Nitrosopumilus sp.]MCV0366152.1 TetR/AcrR family transcriptional regulator [Nitrosopumilus sp.]
METKPPTKIKKRILDTARKTFAKNGFSNTSMDDIAFAAKVSKGGMYHHFPSKDDLFLAIFIENQDSVIKSQPKLFEKKENLIKDLGKLYDSFDFQKDLMRIWLEAMNESAHNSKLKQMVVKRRRHLESLGVLQLKQLSSSLDLLSDRTDSELLQLSKGILAITNGCALFSVTGDNPKQVKQIWIQMAYAMLTSKKIKI